MKNTKNIRHNSGFTLLEMAIVMTIAGFFVVGSFTLSLGINDLQNREETTDHMEIITDALQKFADQHGRLPCPATPSLGPADDNFGRAATGDNCDADPGTGFVVRNQTYGDGEVTQIYVGAVPFTDLGLSPKYGLDGWGRKLTYAVDGQMVIDPEGAGGQRTPGEDLYNGGFMRTVVDDVNGFLSFGAIPMRNYNGNDLARNVYSVPHIEGVVTYHIYNSGAAYALLSHGKNGYGAFSARGGQPLPTDAATDAMEQQNIPTDGAFDGSFIQSPPVGAGGGRRFDDIVIFRKREHMGWEYYNRND